MTIWVSMKGITKGDIQLIEQGYSVLWDENVTFRAFAPDKTRLYEGHSNVDAWIACGEHYHLATAD